MQRRGRIFNDRFQIRKWRKADCMLSCNAKDSKHMDYEERKKQT